MGNPSASAPTSSGLLEPGVLKQHTSSAVFSSTAGAVRPCKVCGGAIPEDRRRVCSDRCARARKTGLQRGRRQRRRIFI
ncbi:MAG: DUF2116 family Zn-ribbon domain-containing protein [Vicinamibacterales bacterium]